jgi:hypothetical protein
MTEGEAPRRQISAWVRPDLIRWLKVRAAKRDLNQSQTIEALIEDAKQQDEGR